MSDPEPFDRAARFGLEAPGWGSWLLETRALVEGASLVLATPWLLAQKKGDGRQIMVLPGYLFGDGTTRPLRRFLRYLGYDALPWSLGRNKGRPEHDAARVVERLASVRRTDEPITLIGWSLGGVIARLVAQRAPDAVRELITLGTPVEGGPKYTSVGQRFARRGEDLDAFERQMHEVNSVGVRVPLTVIYSRGDGIVGWRAAIDRYNPHARHVRVPGSHIGLGVNPIVWHELAEILHASSS